MIWRYTRGSEVHLGVSNRARFPVMFELYSTRFGTATPNPDLGPERATNLEIGWKGQAAQNVRLGTNVFYSDVRELMQTVVRPDTTAQTQNVGNGRFYGVELSLDASLAPRLTVGGNYTAISRTIRDALRPDLRPTGVPTHKAFLYASWRPIARLTFTPSLDVAGDRWSDVNPAPAFPYVRTGSYTLPESGCPVRARPQCRRGVRTQEPHRRALRAGMGVPTARSHVLREDAGRFVVTCRWRETQ